MIRGGDFYENDEPVEDVVSAFDAGRPSETEGGARGYNFSLGPDGKTRLATKTETGRPVVRHSGSEFLRDVADAVVDRARSRSEAESAVDALREWCDQQFEVEDMDGYWLRRELANQVRALLPPDLGTSGGTAGEVNNMGTRVTVRRGGDNEDDRELPGGEDGDTPGGSDSGNRGGEDTGN